MNDADLLDEVLKPIEMSMPYPWKAINDVLYRLRSREIVTFAAGSGIGKSAIVSEIAYHLAQRGDDIGYVALEESVWRTALRFVGLHLNNLIHLPDVAVSY